MIQLATLLHSCLSSEADKKAIQGLRGEDAQSFVDLIQDVRPSPALSALTADIFLDSGQGTFTTGSRVRYHGPTSASEAFRKQRYPPCVFVHTRCQESVQRSDRRGDLFVASQLLASLLLTLPP